MGVEIRKIETTYHETGTNASDRVETTYELGFETTNGGWVKFASVPEHIVTTTDAQAKEAQPEQEAPADPLPPQDEGPTMADVAPTPAPQADAAQQ